MPRSSTRDQKTNSSCDSNKVRSGENDRTPEAAAPQSEEPGTSTPPGPSHIVTSAISVAAGLFVGFMVGRPMLDAITRRGEQATVLR